MKVFFINFIQPIESLNIHPRIISHAILKICKKNGWGIFLDNIFKAWDFHTKRNAYWTMIFPAKIWLLSRTRIPVHHHGFDSLMAVYEPYCMTSYVYQRVQLLYVLYIILHLGTEEFSMDYIQKSKGPEKAALEIFFVMQRVERSS